jgi:hypothetical protein
MSPAATSQRQPDWAGEARRRGQLFAQVAPGDAKDGASVVCIEQRIWRHSRGQLSGQGDDIHDAASQCVRQRRGGVT